MSDPDFQRLLQGDFKPKDPADNERMQRAFVADRPSFVQIENIQDPTTRELIRKWDKMFPAS